VAASGAQGSLHGAVQCEFVAVAPVVGVVGVLVAPPAAAAPADGGGRAEKGKRAVGGG
jgi:hypothetical protein